MGQFAVLRSELSEWDLLLLIRWMSNEHVYRHLNEHQQIASQLKQIYDARLPVLTPLFNRNGRFFILCTGSGQPIGFLRMENAPDNAVEFVIAIGEESMWGQGYGRACLSEALKVAFFDLRKEKVIAHIYKENTRSQHLFSSRSFVPHREGQSLTEYRLSYSDYIQPQDYEEETIA